MKHTPGPWGFGNTNEDKRLVLGDSGKGDYVCNIQIYQTPRNYGLWEEDTRLANAKLIAAAPELLEALKELLQPNNVLTKKGIVMAAKAIAKAEEEE